MTTNSYLRSLKKCVIDSANGSSLAKDLQKFAKLKYQKEHIQIESFNEEISNSNPIKNDIWTKYRPANILDSSYNSPKGMEDYKNYSIFDSK